MAKELMLIINPRSGKGAVKNALFDIIDEFTSAGYIVTVFDTKAPGQATTLAKEHGKNYDLVVCVGGDGTLSDTISGLVTLDAPPPVGYIPMGTANDMAATFKLSRNPRTAAQRVINGKPTPFDVGWFEDHYFSYVHAFGAFTKTSFSTPQEKKKILGHLAYVLEGMTELKNIAPEHCVIEYDGNTIEGDYLFGAVTNSTSVAGLVKLPDSNVHLGDGLFEVLLIKAPKNISELGEIVSQVLSKQYHSDYVTLLHTKNIRFTFDRPISWTRDGEDGGEYKTAEAKNLCRAINLQL